MPAVPVASVATLVAATLGAAAFLITAPVSARSRDAIPAATPTGPAKSCVPIFALREGRVRSDRVIDFRTGGDRWYRVTLPQACPGLGSERRFSYQTSLGQLCQQDIITVLYQTGPARGASCGLAPFQPVRIARHR